MKITFAGAFLVVFGAALAAIAWLPEYVGEGILAHSMLLVIIWPMAVIGVPVCVGTILGVLLGMYRSRERYPKFSQ